MENGSARRRRPPRLGCFVPRDSRELGTSSQSSAPESRPHNSRLPHECKWNAGCGQRFKSKRQLFDHLEQAHGLRRAGSRWNSSGYGARARRREARWQFDDYGNPVIQKVFNASKTPTGNWWLDPMPPRRGPRTITWGDEIHSPPEGPRDQVCGIFGCRFSSDSQGSQRLTNASTAIIATPREPPSTPQAGSPWSWNTNDSQWGAARGCLQSASAVEL